jgi:uncharacterized protein YndB with AHSA1/START domain
VTVHIENCITLHASPDEVWRHIEDVSAHGTWMHDAAAIEFRTDQRTGVGTEYEVLTKIGPLRNRDLVRVTRWEPGAYLGIEHNSSVTGTAYFRLEPDGTCTRLCWSEVLTFPWWMGGVLGEQVAKPVLGRVWRNDLRRLKRRIDS